MDQRVTSEQKRLMVWWWLRKRPCLRNSPLVIDDVPQQDLVMDETLLQSGKHIHASVDQMKLALTMEWETIKQLVQIPMDATQDETREAINQFQTQENLDQKHLKKALSRMKRLRSFIHQSTSPKVGGIQSL